MRNRSSSPAARTFPPAVSLCRRPLFLLLRPKKLNMTPSAEVSREYRRLQRLTYAATHILQRRAEPAGQGRPARSAISRITNLMCETSVKGERRWPFGRGLARFEGALAVAVVSRQTEVVADDLTAPDLAELDWTPERRAVSLLAVYRHAVGLAVEAEEWYRGKRPSKARWGRWLRVGAIMLGSVAVILPVLAEISTTSSGPVIAPGWAAIALAAAATLVGLDHFFGFSSAWMRFMTAELKLTRLRHDFEYAWSARRALAGESPTDDEVAALVELARALVLAVDDVITEETGGWVAEFRGSLDRTEQSVGSSARQ